MIDYDCIKNKRIIKVTPCIFYINSIEGHKMLEFGWLYWSFVIVIKKGEN